jgi:uncharacterized protein
MKDYPIAPVPFTGVAVTDAFWLPRLETNRTVTIPYVLKKCWETGRVHNFVKAAGDMPGQHEGREFNDSDVYKAIEGVGYSLQLQRDPELEAEIDDLIGLIAKAQEDDGYLYTARTVDPEAVNPDVHGPTRWSNLRVGHELYCLGHLYEAAVAYYQATGKRSLLDIATKSAELILSVFGPDKKRDVPGHQEVEIGLVKLYRVTGDGRYLSLAKFFLDERGHPHGRALYSSFGLKEYMQDHLPVVEQREAAGHAVRAGYMYSAMADVAALADAREYLPALEAIWDNVVSKKMYLTGGVGSRHQGEAFGEDYELPNLTAYNETCAAIANIMWNHRMFLLHGDGKFIDVLERTLYNGYLAGVSLDGAAFFYPNPLESDGRYAFNIENVATRSPWFSCSCCPTNVVRFFPSLLGYIYAQRDATVYVNLFVQGQAGIDLDDAKLTLRQDTSYPWDGRVKITVDVEKPVSFTLALRVPGWARDRPVPSDLYRYLDDHDENSSLRLNGESVDMPLTEGYAFLHRTWRPGDVVELHLPMPVRRVASHDSVAENNGKVAVERGPIVYCAEAADNKGRALDLVLADGAKLTPRFDERLLGGVMIVEGGGVTLIPYYAWSHRGVGEMAIWLRRRG